MSRAVPIYRPSSFRMRQEGTRVVFIINGRRVVDVDWRDADIIANAFRAKARQAEEHEKHAAVTLDGAIALRAGMPIGFSEHPKIREEIAKTAAWDSRLRRFMKAKFPAAQPRVPKIIVRPPTPPKEGNEP